MTAIAINDRMGVYLVLEFLRREGKRKFYKVQCTKCGIEREVGDTTLREADRNNTEHCLHCNEFVREERVSTKMCPVCCNMPWARKPGKPMPLRQILLPRAHRTSVNPTVQRRVLFRQLCQ